MSNINAFNHLTTYSLEITLATFENSPLNLPDMFDHYYIVYVQVLHWKFCELNIIYKNQISSGV